MKSKNQTGLIFILGSLIAISPFSIDMYLPAFPAIAASLKTDIAHVGYSLTSYYAGLCVGQLLYGILIDRFGRKMPLLIGLVIYLAAAIGCAFCVSIDFLIAIRLLMALGGCVGLVASRAIVRDIFLPSDTARVLSQLVLVMGLAPIVAPTIGGFVTTWLGWRWVFGVMGFIAVTLIATIVWLLPETKKADQSVSLKISKIGTEYVTLLQHPTFLIYSLAGGISYAGMYAYIAGSPFVFMEQFGFSDSSFSWAFGFNACGLILGSQLNRLALKKYSSDKICLWASIILFITGLSLLLITLTSIASAALMLCFTFLFLFCLGFINPNTTAMALQPFSAAAGRASAVLGSLQMIAGVLASWLVSFLNNGTLVIMPTVMFGCTIVTLGLLFVFQRLNASRSLVKVHYQN